MQTKVEQESLSMAIPNNPKNSAHSAYSLILILNLVATRICSAAVILMVEHNGRQIQVVFLHPTTWKNENTKNNEKRNCSRNNSLPICNLISIRGRHKTAWLWKVSCPNRSITASYKNVRVYCLVCTNCRNHRFGHANGSCITPYGIIRGVRSHANLYVLYHSHIKF